MQEGRVICIRSTSELKGIILLDRRMSNCRGCRGQNGGREKLEQYGKTTHVGLIFDYVATSYPSYSSFSYVPRIKIVGKKGQALVRLIFVNLTKILVCKPAFFLLTLFWVAGKVFGKETTDGPLLLSKSCR